MAKLSLTETQAVAELADVLYSFLPGSGAIFTWREAAGSHGLDGYWIGGSKLPAITQLLERILENRRDRFCDFILTVVREGMKYRVKKQNPVTRQDVEKLNSLLLRLRFKIPELHDSALLAGLRSSPGQVAASRGQPATQTAAVVSSEAIESLRKQYTALFAMQDAQARGFAFEKLLDELFAAHSLAPRGAFRLAGEQIDGSFEWNGGVFLVEARWRTKPADAADLLVLRGKAEKSEWTRGLFISINGFSSLATETLRMGRRANLIAMSGEDLALILEGHWTLEDALRVKLRHTGETGDAYLPLSKAREK